jgi:hypothetical protein
MKKKIKVIANVEMIVWVNEDIQGNQEIEDIEEVTEINDWEEKK